MSNSVRRARSAPCHRLALAGLALGIAVSALPACSSGTGRTGPGGAVAEGHALRAFTGAPARIVWKRGGTASGPGQIAGLDSEDGKGMRILVAEPGSYQRPLLSPDGREVVYSDAGDGQVYALPFDGGPVRALGEGTALSTWRDPDDGSQWVVMSARDATGGEPGAWRIRLDDPSRRVDLWTRTAVAGGLGAAGWGWFGLSADGAHAVGTFPYPRVGVADLRTGRWEMVGHGCWTDLCPDGSGRMFHFLGSHRAIRMLDLPDRTSDAPAAWEVDLTTHPLLRGQAVHTPRWSRHPRILALAGPSASDRPDLSEIMLARLTPDLRRVEAWLRVTDDRVADLTPDLWVAPDRAAPATVQTAPWLRPPPDPEGDSAWPHDRRGLVFLWRNQQAGGAIPDDRAGERPLGELVESGAARFGPHHELRLAGGTARAEGAGPRLARRFRETGELTFEAILMPGPLSAEPRMIVSLQGASVLFALLQVEDRLELDWMLTRDGETRRRRGALGRILPGQAQHVAVSLASQNQVLFLNGRAVSGLAARGDGSAWTEGELTFGDGDWAGRLDHIAFYDRALDDGEVAARHAGLRESLDRRLDPPKFQVQAVLRQVTATPDVRDLAPYRRALATRVYEVTGTVPEGVDARRILVAEWVVLDLVARPEAIRRVPGQVESLRLERMEDHPQLESERLLDDSGEPGLPLFLRL